MLQTVAEDGSARTPLLRHGGCSSLDAAGGVDEVDWISPADGYMAACVFQSDARTELYHCLWEHELLDDKTAVARTLTPAAWLS